MQTNQISEGVRQNEDRGTEDEHKRIKNPNFAGTYMTHLKLKPEKGAGGDELGIEWPPKDQNLTS